MKPRQSAGLLLYTRHMTMRLADSLLGQWQSAPRVSGLVSDVLQPILDNALDAFARLQLMLDINEAEGIWLDYLGVRVGIRRPTTSDPAQDPRFGFDQAGVGFDQAPFRGAAANDAVFPLPDPVFRGFVKARAILVLGNGTVQTFRHAVHQVDPSAVVTDNRDMTVDVTTQFTELLQLADDIGAFPRTAGVRVEYAAP